MRSHIRRAEQSALYKNIDRIHKPEVYDLKEGDSEYVEMDTFVLNFSEYEKAPVVDLKPLAVWQPPMMRNQDRFVLQQKKQVNFAKIREEVAATNSQIIPRTQIHNRKCAELTIEEERITRSDVVGAQLKAWRSLLPSLLKKLSRIPDPRQPKSIKHKLVTLMVFGLFAFILRLESRRAMNRELTSAAIQSNLKKVFPELATIPHADTLARLLESIDPQAIEQAHVELIKDLIKSKKFKKLLINGALPISIDGTQKLVRDGLLQDGRWCERTVGDGDAQQYMYTIEANITFQNGLTIPLLTEYLHRDNNQLTNPTGKQDCELTAFDRMAERLNNYFPRLKMILFMDALYATQGVMSLCYKNDWDYMIYLPKQKLKNLSKNLNQKKEHRQMIPGQSHYRKRRQEFYWQNNVVYGDALELNIHLLGCLERYPEVNKKTGDIETHYTENTWISSVPLSIDTVHELYNLGARKKELIEDSINTEKNRGYHCKHAFSYDWNAMQGFHYLMRLAHAINALSEFTKKLKQFIKEKGCAATLKLIKETLCSPWLSGEWYESQLTDTPELRLQLE